MYVGDPRSQPLPWYLRPLFRRQRRRFGTELLPARVWARVPALYFALAGFYAALERRRSPLPPALRSLVQVRVSQINHCPFCVDLNGALAAERGLADDKLLALAEWRDHAAFDAQERLVLEYVEVMTHTGQRVDAALAARLRDALGELGLIELTALIAFQNLSSKFNAALDIPAQGLCVRPPPGVKRQAEEPAPEMPAADRPARPDQAM
jgi:AhpD family alkylhydroperoxidase